MLGVVRIYSKKVNYLVQECRDAMWKIKLVIHASDVDLATTTSAAGTIDLGFFGQVQEDFPDLADTAYAEDMLTQYDELRVARGRTLAHLDDTTEPELELSPIKRRRESRFRRETSESKDYNIEIGRHETRTSKSSRLSKFSQFEEEPLPPVHEDEEIVAPKVSIGQDISRFEDFGFDLPTFDEVSSSRPSEASTSGILSSSHQINEISVLQEEPLVEEVAPKPIPIGEEIIPEPRKSTSSFLRVLGLEEKLDKVTKTRPQKRPRLEVSKEENEEPIELSVKQFKEFLKDTTPILRRGIRDPLPPPSRTYAGEGKTGLLVWLFA